MTYLCLSRMTLVSQLSPLGTHTLSCVQIRFFSNTYELSSTFITAKSSIPFESPNSGLSGSLPMTACHFNTGKVPLNIQTLLLSKINFHRESSATLVEAIHALVAYISHRAIKFFLNPYKPCLNWKSIQSITRDLTMPQNSEMLRSLDSHRPNKTLTRHIQLDILSITDIDLNTTY